MRQHTISIREWATLENLEAIPLPPCNPQIDVPHMVEIFAMVGKGTPIINKIMNNEIDQDVKEILWYSVLNKRLIEKPSSILVRGKSGKLYPFKIRPNYDTIPLSVYVEYNEIHSMYHDYQEVVGKFIIIDKTQFNSKGREILSEL